MADHPFDETAKAAKAWVDKGAVIFQKFTCEKCGARQTMDAPNTFYTHGMCEECGHCTDIKTRGCNYLMIV